MPLSEASGTVAPGTLGVETNLFNQTSGLRTWQTVIFTDALTGDDEIIVKVYIYDPVALSQKLWRTYTISGVQADPAFYVPGLQSQQYRVSVTQTKTTLRTFNWARYEFT